MVVLNLSNTNKQVKEVLQEKKIFILHLKIDFKLFLVPFFLLLRNTLRKTSVFSFKFPFDLNELCVCAPYGILSIPEWMLSFRF